MGSGHWPFAINGCLASSLLFILGRHTKQKIALDRTTSELGVILSLYFYLFTIIIISISHNLPSLRVNKSWKLFTVIIFWYKQGKLSPVKVFNKSRQGLALNNVAWAHAYKIRKISRDGREGRICCHRSKLWNMEPWKVGLGVLHIGGHKRTNNGNYTKMT